MIYKIQHLSFPKKWLMAEYWNVEKLRFVLILFLTNFKKIHGFYTKFQALMSQNKFLAFQVSMSHGNPDYEHPYDPPPCRSLYSICSSHLWYLDATTPLTQPNHLCPIPTPGFPLFSKYQMSGFRCQIPGTSIQISVIKILKCVKTDAGFPLLWWHKIPCIF